ncbi:alpha/beta hydrolase [Siphonobacter sp.]|uniref:alpha/beta hydrolase n=1 Tax=Siphonobacter sp. TaxID=1869184 RepID=UPI003B3AB1E0
MTTKRFKVQLLRWLGGVILVIFLIINVLMAFHAYRFTYFYEAHEAQFRRPEQMTTGEKLSQALFGFRIPKRSVNETPDWPYQTIRLKNERNQTLVGWYSPVEEAPKGTVILWHGHGSAKSRVLAEATYFRRLGYAVALFDFRAHGQSDGNVCTIGYHETNDVKTVYDWVRAKGEQRIILWGMSMGAATILKAIPEFNLQPTKVIVECPFASLEDAVRGRLRSLHLPEQPLANLLLFYGGLERNLKAWEYQPAEYARKLTMPVLLQWGRSDPRVSRDETDRIYYNLASSQKQLVIYQESGHQSFCRHETDRWERTVHNFLNR